MPLQSGRITVSLTDARGGHKKGVQTLQLDVPMDRYRGEFMDLGEIVRGRKKLAREAANDTAVHATVPRASGMR